MIRVVLDTNVLVSAVYLPQSKPAEVLKLVRKERIRNIISSHILDELKDVLLNKFCWEESKLRKTLYFLKTFSDTVSYSGKIKALDYDPDNRILECAVSGGADFIVSGDKKHLLKLGRYGSIIIVDPAEFLRIFERNEN